MENLFNLIFPPCCKFCGKFGFIICPKCLNQTVRLVQQFCLICGKESFSGFTHEKCMYKDVPYRLYSFFSYEGIVREGIKQSKYGLYEFSILKKLTDYGMLGNIQEITNLAGTVLVPVPVSHQKLLKRGFNHAELIAQIVARSLNNTRVVDLLSRCVDTPTQHDLDRAKRFENIRNAFSVKKNSLNSVIGKDFTLIDDIVTSGATMLETARTLYQSGARSVACLTLSRKLLE